MYVAMNRFKVLKDSTERFEQHWLNRESYLHELNGFCHFQMLRGSEREDHVLYSSYTLWSTKADFEGWTRSEQFRKTHERAGTTGAKMTLGHPEFEGFEVFQSIDASAKKSAA